MSDPCPLLSCPRSPPPLSRRSSLLVDEAPARLKPEGAEPKRVVVLKFFGELRNAEIAETLELAPRTLDRPWAHARARRLRRLSELA